MLGDGIYANVSFGLFFFLQVHVDLRQQWEDLNVDRLLEMFVVSKMTGLEKPGAVEFEEFLLEGDTQVNPQVPQQLPDYLQEAPVPVVSAVGSVREGRTQTGSIDFVDVFHLF